MKHDPWTPQETTIRWKLVAADVFDAFPGEPKVPSHESCQAKMEELMKLYEANELEEDNEIGRGTHVFEPSNAFLRDMQACVEYRRHHHGPGNCARCGCVVLQYPRCSSMVMCIFPVLSWCNAEKTGHANVSCVDRC